MVPLTDFLNIWKMICHTEFKCGSINFYKLNKGPAKY